jgi:hypothetical protein
MKTYLGLLGFACFFLRYKRFYMTLAICCIIIVSMLSDLKRVNEEPPPPPTFLIFFFFIYCSEYSKFPTTRLIRSEVFHVS